MESLSPLPRSIPGSAQSLSEEVSVSILIDRHLILHICKGVLVNLTPEEAHALRVYLAKHSRKWLGL